MKKLFLGVVVLGMLLAGGFVGSDLLRESAELSAAPTPELQLSEYPPFSCKCGTCCVDGICWNRYSNFLEFCDPNPEREANPAGELFAAPAGLCAAATPPA